MNIEDFTDVVRARFWAKVEIRGPNECWPWIAGRKDRNHGYGAFRPKGNLRPEGSHRVAYFITKGPFNGLIRHDCDNESCCNPDHLRPGDTAANCKDKMERARFRGRNNAEALSDAEIEKLSALLKIRGIQRELLASQMGWSMRRLHRAIRVVRNLKPEVTPNWRMRNFFSDGQLLTIFNEAKFERHEGVATRWGIKLGSLRNILKRFHKAEREGKPPFYFWVPPLQVGKSRIRKQ